MDQNVRTIVEENDDLQPACIKYCLSAVSHEIHSGSIIYVLLLLEK